MLMEGECVMSTLKNHTVAAVGKMSKLVLWKEHPDKGGLRMSKIDCFSLCQRDTGSAAPCVTRNQREATAFTSRRPPNVKLPAVVTVTDE